MAQGTAHIGFLGKHPAFGDFISAGLDPVWAAAFEDWLTGMLAQMRCDKSEAWESFYDTARPLRFWLGGHVLGKGGSCRGVILVSRDKVGRRYPFVLVQANAPDTPPPLDPDQSFFEQAEVFGASALNMSPETADALLPAGDDVSGEGPITGQLWALNPSSDVAGLLHDTATADHIRAAAPRSYWWCAGQAEVGSSMVSTAGLPDAAACAWVLSGDAAGLKELEA